VGDRFAAEAEGEYLCAEDTVLHRVSHMLHDNILFIMRRHPPNIVTQPDLPVGCATRRERDGQTGEGRTRLGAQPTGRAGCVTMLGGKKRLQDKLNK